MFVRSPNDLSWKVSKKHHYPITKKKKQQLLIRNFSISQTEFKSYNFTYWIKLRNHTSKKEKEFKAQKIFEKMEYFDHISWVQFIKKENRVEKRRKLKELTTQLSSSLLKRKADPYASFWQCPVHCGLQTYQLHAIRVLATKRCVLYD